MQCTDCENTINLVYYSGVRSQFLLWGGGNNPNVPTEKEKKRKIHVCALSCMALHTISVFDKV